ncbi:hypothetical protein DSM3645_02743 [Blastopirellula marina DSM 3645]|uniref:Uncharacterized protein n=1 Tax=Blastopirellula marina DSM 3645 TaxID=314230 RepID=A3ZVL2_9BACT|nr:hypothetical protein DSM3645_02743 [Blastopirellula marina DSM 3645]
MIVCRSAKFARSCVPGSVATRRSLS